MNRPIKALALAAFALAAALGATATQASAANFTVNFKIKDADPALSMIRTSSLPSTVTGMGAATSVASLAFDPSTGNGTYSDLLPALNQSAHVDITYAQASDGISNPCTFTITVSHDSNVLQPYLVQFSRTAGTNCVVPTSTPRSSNGVFSGTYELDWST
jgi:hypothetical protein